MAGAAAGGVGNREPDGMNEAASHRCLLPTRAGGLVAPAARHLQAGHFEKCASVMPLSLAAVSFLIRARRSRLDTIGKSSERPGVHRELPGLALPCVRRVLTLLPSQRGREGKPRVGRCRGHLV